MFDLNITIQFDDRIFQGRGTNSNQEIAFLKAFCEACEHYLTYKLNLQNNNGLSIHLTKEQANQKSRDELIERDAFLCHHLLNANFSIFENDLTRTYSNKINNKNQFIQYFKLSTDKNIILAIGNVNYFKEPSILFGIDLNSNLNEAITHSTLELIRQLNYYNYNSKENISIEEFNNLEIYRFKDHELIGLNPNYCKKLFNQKNKFLSLEYSEIDNMTTFDEINPKMIHKNFPFKISIAKNNQLQQLWLGKTEFKNINKTRISSITRDSEINFLPHFFN